MHKNYKYQHTLFF